jgi:ATP-binding cassette subfamily B protein
MVKMILRCMRWLWTASYGIRKRLFLDAFLGLFRVAAGLAFIYVSKELIDMATRQHNVPVRQLIVNGILLLVLILAEMGAGLLTTWLSNQTEIKMKNFIRRKLFAHLMNAYWEGKEKLHSGDVLNRLEEDVRVVTDTLCNSMPALLVTGAQLLAAFVFLAYMSSFLAWAIIFIMPFFLLVSKLYIKKMRKLTNDIRTTDSNVQSVLQESLQHRIVIQTMEQSETMTDKLHGLQRKLYGQTMKRTRFNLFSRAMVSLGFVFGYMIAFMWSIIQLHSGGITFGIMTAFLQLVGQIQRPTVDLTRQLPAFIHASTSIDRLSELEEIPAEEKDVSHPLRDIAGIRLSNVSFRYAGGSRDIFNHFSYDFVPGSRTAVVGPTGAGKSTMIRLMLSLLHPQEGDIVLYNNRGETLPVDANSRCNLVYVPQGNSLLSGTIRDNLLLGNPDATDEELFDVLYTAAAEFVRDLPDGLDSRCGEQGAGLSEGQAQRIAIARGLLRPGSILLLDEFSSSLDGDTESLLIQRLLGSRQEKTMIFITHREKILQYCSKVIQLTAPES